MALLGVLVLFWEAFEIWTYRCARGLLFLYSLAFLSILSVIYVLCNLYNLSISVHRSSNFHVVQITTALEAF